MSARVPCPAPSGGGPHTVLGLTYLYMPSPRTVCDLPYAIPAPSPMAWPMPYALPPLRDQKRQPLTRLILERVHSQGMYTPLQVHSVEVLGYGKSLTPSPT